jgi:hypothetical protein
MEFERRRDQLRDAATIADPRDAQIARLKDQVRQFTERVTATQQDNDELTAFRTLALSRLAAQHEEISDCVPQPTPKTSATWPQPAAGVPRPLP